MAINATQPNMLLIMTDQHRFDRLSCMSGNIPRTPHLDRLAFEGVRFTNAYTPSPVCAPARAAIKSGMYPPGCGVVGNWVPFKEGVELLTERLRHQGYETALVGKLHFVPPLRRFGFDRQVLHDAPYSTYAHDDRYSAYIHWLRHEAGWQEEVDPVALFDGDEEAFRTNDWYRFIMGSNFRTEAQHDTTWTTDVALRYLEERDRDKPFFLFVSYFGPHQPFDVPDPWHRLYDPNEIVLPPQFDADMSAHPIFQATCGARARQFKKMFDREAYRRMLAAYYGQVSMIDHQIGRLFEKMTAKGEWENTLVIFVSDHGDHNGAYGLFFKGQMYDSCCKIPLLIKPPRYRTGGLVRKEVVNTLDLYGTILDMAGDNAWRAPHIEARSLLPLFEAGPVVWGNRAWSIIGADATHNLTMLRQDNLKLIRLARGQREPLYEMYDLCDEVVETRNVYEDSTYRAEREALRAELDTWWRLQAERYPAKVCSYVRRDN